MKFHLTVECDNDAFLPIVGDELAVVLRDIADRVEGCEYQTLKRPSGAVDSNGNSCASFYMADE